MLHHGGPQIIGARNGVRHEQCPNHRPHDITTAAQLALLFGEMGEASRKKEVSFVHPHYRAILQALTASDINGEKYDRELPDRQRATLY